MIVSCPSCQRNYVVADDQIAGKQFRARCKSCGVEFRLDGMSTSRDASTPPNQDEPAKFMSATEAFLSLRTAPPPTTGTWSVCLSKTDTRRMSTEEVVAAYSKGTISTNILVWKTGMPKWVRLSEVPELMTALGNPAGKPTGGAGRSEPATPAKSEAPERAGASVPSGNPSKSIKPRTRTATLMGTGTPSARPASSVAPRTGRTSPPPPPEMDNSSGMKRGALAPPPVPTFSSKPPPNADTVRRSIPAPPRRALDIPIEVDLANPAAPSVGDATVQAANDGKLPSLALEPVIPANGEGMASAASEEKPSVEPQPNSEAAQPGSDKHAEAAQSGSHKHAEAVQPGSDKHVEAVQPGTDKHVEEAAGGIVLPPLTTSRVDGAAAGSIAAADSLISARAKTPSPSTKSVRPKTDLGTARASESTRDSRPSSSRAGRLAATATDRDSYPEFRRRPKSRFAGMVIAMSAVGIVGVLGGVAGAVYVMKTIGGGRPAVSVVALQPQAAMPASAEHVSNSTSDGPRTASDVTAAAASTDTRSAAASTAPPAASSEPEKARSVSHAQPRGASHGASPKAASKVPSPASESAAAAVGFSAPAAAPPAAAAAPAPTPATANGVTSFNRDSAMAVLGYAASRAPRCKKPDGPKGTSKIHVTFDTSGSVVGANLAGGPLAGTSVGQCIAGIFKKIKVPPFAGERVTISRDVTIPP